MTFPRRPIGTPAAQTPRQRAELPNRRGMDSYGGHKKSDAKAESTKAEGGTAKSNGDQYSDSGHNKSDVEANTKAYQDNWLVVEQGQKCTPALAAMAETTTRRKVEMFTSRPVSRPTI